MKIINGFVLISKTYINRKTINRHRLLVSEVSRQSNDYFTALSDDGRYKISFSSDFVLITKIQLKKIVWDDVIKW